MRYLLCLSTLLCMQLVAWAVSPLLPIFKTWRCGPLNNGSTEDYDWRLPLWLSWFDTPDNSLRGDANWQASHDGGDSYWNMVAWLYRNSLYGFRWSALAVQTDLAHMLTSGDPRVNRNNGIYGLFTADQPKGVWQWKLVKPVIGNWGVMWNFGWQLDDAVKGNVDSIAMFQFSPRFVTFTS